MYTPKTAYSTHFRSCFDGLSARRKESLVLTFISKGILFAFPSSRMGLGFAISADRGTIHFHFPVQVFDSSAVRL